MLASPALRKVDGLGTRANDQIAVEGVEGCVVVNTVTPHHSELRAESARFGHGGKGATRRHGLHLGFTTMALKDLIDALGAPREALGRRGRSRMNRAKHADQVGGMPRRNLCSMARNTFPCRRPIEKDRHVSPTTHLSVSRCCRRCGAGAQESESARRRFQGRQASRFERGSPSRNRVISRPSGENGPAGSGLNRGSTWSPKASTAPTRPPHRTLSADTVASGAPTQCPATRFRRSPGSHCRAIASPNG